MVFLKTYSGKQTRDAAKLLAKEILVCKKNIFHPLILSLEGDLGAGKTTFVQGFMAGIGIKKKIISPTFIIFKSYKLKIIKQNYERIYHFDFYRIKGAKEILNLGVKEILNNPKNIVLIEWPEKIKKHLPKNTVWIKFKYGEKENERKITISN